MFGLSDFGAALVGGVMIGVSVSMILLFNGRIAGLSGVVAGTLSPARGEFGWRVAFLAGMALVGAVVGVWRPELIADNTGASLSAVVLSGFMVGFGVRLGSGCTSGHGICGISRLSPRSLVATLCFMAAGVMSAVALGVA